MGLVIFGIILPWIFAGLLVGVGSWIAVQLIGQNGRLLSRLETLEDRFRTLQVAQPCPPAGPVAVPQPNHGPGGPLRLPAGSHAPHEPLLIKHQPLRGLGGVPVGPSAIHVPLIKQKPLGDSHGLSAGSPAPEFELPDLEGRRHSLVQFRGRRVLLIFFNPGCGFCVQMASDLAALSKDSDHGRPVPLLISTGDRGQNVNLVREHGIGGPVLLQEAMEVASRYQAYGTPIGCLVDEQGNIASGLAMGAHAVLSLARAPQAFPSGGMAQGGESDRSLTLGGTRSLKESKILRHGLAPGTPAPSFRVPRIGSGELELETYRGKRVLLVFSDPNCGPCDALAPLLEQRQRASATLKVLMMSRGDTEAIRLKAAQHRLTFPIGLQRQWEVSRAYGIFATPVAYVIDERGVIAADVAVGSESILAMLAREETGNNNRAGRECKGGEGIELCTCGKSKKDDSRSKTERPLATPSPDSRRVPIGKEQP